MSLSRREFIESIGAGILAINLNKSFEFQEGSNEESIRHVISVFNDVKLSPFAFDADLNPEIESLGHEMKLIIELADVSQISVTKTDRNGIFIDGSEDELDEYDLPDNISIDQIISIHVKHVVTLDGSERYDFGENREKVMTEEGKFQSELVFFEEYAFYTPSEEQPLSGVIFYSSLNSYDLEDRIVESRKVRSLNANSNRVVWNPAEVDGSFQQIDLFPPTSDEYGLELSIADMSNLDYPQIFYYIMANRIDKSTSLFEEDIVLLERLREAMQDYAFILDDLDPTYPQTEEPNFGLQTDPQI